MKTGTGQGAGGGETKRSATPAPLQTVDRALQILQSFNDDHLDWGVYELAEEFGWDKSTAQRLLATLAGRGFVHSDPVTRRYSLGPRMWAIANHWERSGGFGEFVRPTLSALSQKTGRNSLLAVPDGAYVRCVAAVTGRLGPMRVTPLVGDLYPAHAGATSRAYFAFLSARDRRALLIGRSRERFGDKTLVDDIELERAFARTVADGYAYSTGEFDPSTRALAVPVFADHQLIGSLSIGERKTDDSDELLDHLPAVQAAADELGRLLSSADTTR